MRGKEKEESSAQRAQSVSSQADINHRVFTQQIFARSRTKRAEVGISTERLSVNATQGLIPLFLHPRLLGPVTQAFRRPR